MFILHLIRGLHCFNRGRELYSRPAWPNIQHCNLSIFRLACASSVLLSDGISNRMQHCWSQLNSRAFISLSALEYTERETGALKSCRAPSSTYAFYWLVLIHIKFKTNNLMFKLNKLIKNYIHTNF